jgi:hypothetical protein
MKRSDLIVGERYAGPGDGCYEIVDLSPGWRIDNQGQWVEDGTTSTRHMPGKGDVPYRSNLALRAHLLVDGTPIGDRQRTVVDPRKLTGPWSEHESTRNTHETRRVHANRLMTLMRRNLRGYPGYKPGPMTAYQVSQDGLAVTLPVEDLSALVDMAFRSPE